MVNFVIKKDGANVPFDLEKIKASIMLVALKSGLSLTARSNLTQEVLDSVFVAFSGKEEVSTFEIKEKILSVLDAIAPDVSKVWKKYDQSGKTNF